ncbi:BLOC-1-related complex subunit 6 [Folsomia candida]|uniref:BLOC-1-related complex subunit 6 C-terminal helix domain-containing protein n=1 Tax=Folsomia candida TaxID=158441 RepID=A0A226F1N0_FOLCA|nr:BLOC-1-related complex subunit 6 [Folsomia candida]OXA63337.1 hypothetical protein Fcan01_03114 [Folsomia candida]
MDQSGGNHPACSLDDTTAMTSSYHEINVSERGEEETDHEMTLPVKRLLNKARNWVGDLSMDGVVTQEGQQVTYVAQDLTERMKISTSPNQRNIVTSRNSSVQEHGHLDDICVSDLNLMVNEMEMEAKKLAQSVDTLTENLTGILHSLSSMTVDCVFTASDGVSQLCDTADASIKVMYQVMAKCEELNKAVQPLYQVNQQIKETKRLLDKVEAEMN